MTEPKPPTLAELGRIADDAFHSLTDSEGNKYAWQAVAAAILERLAQAGEQKVWREMDGLKPAIGELRFIAAEAEEVEE